MNGNEKKGHAMSQQKTKRASGGTVPTKQYTYTAQGFREISRYANIGVAKQHSQQPSPSLQRGKNRSPSIKKKKRRKLLFSMIVLLLIIAAVFAVILLMPGSADVLIGTWAFDTVTVYEFDGAGNGAMVLPTAQYIFSYSIEEDQLHIDFEDERITDVVYTFTIQDDNLTFVSPEGATQFTLSKQ